MVLNTVLIRVNKLFPLSKPTACNDRLTLEILVTIFVSCVCNCFTSLFPSRVGGARDLSSEY